MEKWQMAENHVLPEELQMIFRQIGVNLADGPESEGGLFFLRNIESALEKDKIDSDYFGQNYPHLVDSVKAIIAIELLYQLIKSKFLVKIEMSRYERGPDGNLRKITVLEHLETLVKLFKLSETSDTQVPQD